MVSSEMKGIIEGFRRHLGTEKAKNHLAWLRERESREVKEILDKLQALSRGNSEFIELVLYGLLPHGDTKYAKRISIAPSFLNIKKFFSKRFNYTQEDWKELSNLVYELVVSFQENPENSEMAIRDFVSNRLSKGLQCGSISPIFFALNPDFPMVNNRVIRTYSRLHFLVFYETDKLSQRLENYLSNVEKIKRLAETLARKFGFNEITDMTLFGYLCYWFDVQEKRKKTKKKLREEKSIVPIDDKLMESFYKSLTCSEPQPFFVAMGDTRNLQKLDADNKIIYNTEFQRGAVWNPKRKQKLIDSILRGYSINTIFLRQLRDGRFECIDGQQRLRTILKEFLNDKFPISPDITPEFNRRVTFGELPPYLQTKIKQFKIWAILFYTDEDAETCRVFLRLQEGLPLNSAEKLNAMMGFLRDEIVQLTKHPIMAKIGIRDYRFAHRYILAQSYLLTLRNQITDTKFRNLQEMYRTFKKTRPSRIVMDTTRKVLDSLDREFGEDAKVIKKRADFISLFLLSKHVLENYANAEKLGLKDFFIRFAAKVGEVESSEPEENALYFDYRTYRKTSADSKNSIEKRFEIILPKFLEFNAKLQPKDSKRDFDDWQRLAIYRRDKGICKICGRETPFGEGTVDHITPHSKGGLTIVDNGQWSCIPCNLKKRDSTESEVVPFGSVKEIQTLSGQIFRLLSDCNNICASKSKDEIFKLTSKVLGRVADVSKPVKTKDDFGNLIDALYEIVYEGSGSLKRIPEAFLKSDFIGFTIKFVRADLRHDLEHGTEKEIKKKRERLSRIYKRYVDKTAISSLESRDFSKLHLDFLKEAVTFLKELKKHCVHNMT